MRVSDGSDLLGLLAVAMLVTATLGTGARADPPSDTAPESSPEGNASDAGEDRAGGMFARRELAPREPVPEEAVDELRSRIDDILDERVAPEARVGIAVADTTTGQLLYARNAAETFNPASNMKLWTAAAALDRFGPSHTFETDLLATRRTSGVVEGGLYLRGEGDAFLLFEDVISWAAQLRLEGIERIEGGLVVDDTLFDGNYLPPLYDQKDEDDSYRAPIGAVSINFNAVTAIATPATEAGTKPSVRMFPPNDYVVVDNRAETVDGSGRNLVFKSDPTGDGATEIVIEGSIGTDAEEMRSRLRIDHPPAFAGSILKRALAMVDVEFEGSVRRGETPDEAEVLVDHRSQPLSYIVLAMNKWSNNFMAEQLLRRLGATDEKESTWPRARRRVRKFVREVGISPKALTIENGSGLYTGNAVAPRQFVRLLTHMLDHRAAPEFVGSLAIAGTDGTLRDRMRESPLAGNLRAKTGTLNRVSALSGYVRTRSNRLLAFSMLFNDTPRKGWFYRPVQDEIAGVLAAFDQ